MWKSTGPGPGALRRRDRHRVEQAGREEIVEEDWRPFPVPNALRWQDRHHMNRPGESTMLKSTGGRARAIVLPNKHMVVVVHVDQGGAAAIGGNTRWGGIAKVIDQNSINMLSNHRIIFVLNIRPSIKTMHYYFTQ